MQKTEFTVGDKLMDLNTGEIGEVIEVDAASPTIYFLIMEDGEEACYIDAPLMPVEFAKDKA